jgi:hypothetical protein
MRDSKISRTYTPQAGIFALGTSSHAYLEFDLVDPNKIEELVSAIAAIREPDNYRRSELCDRISP